MERKRACGMALLGLVGLGILGLSGCPRSLDEAELALDPIGVAFNLGGEFEVRHVNGEITVTRGTGNRIVINALKKVRVLQYMFADDRDPESFLEDEAFDISVEGQGDSVVLETLLPPARAGITYVVDYDIQIPHLANVDISSVNGEILVRGVEGKLTIDLDNGDIRLDEIGGEIRADLINGEMTIEHPYELLANERIQVSLVNGSVQVRLPDDSSFELDAAAENGEISNGGFDFDASGFVTERVDETVGDGGAVIDIEVTNGEIEFEQTGPPVERPTIEEGEAQEAEDAEGEEADGETADGEAGEEEGEATDGEASVEEGEAADGEAGEEDGEAADGENVDGETADGEEETE